MSAVPSLLSAILPTSRQTLFLRACLQSDHAGRRAWQAWSREVGDPLTALRDGERVRSLLPLLLSALRRNDIQPDAALLTYLRAALLTERLRTRAYRRICGRAISLLTEHRVPAILLRGAALAETVYSEPALRHCHDIDVLVNEGDVVKAARVLSLMEFKTPRNVRSDALHATLVHQSGLPLVFHSRVFEMPYYELPFQEVWARSLTLSVGDAPARFPSWSDHLLHVCAHASSSPSRSSLRWACDAWLLIERGSDLDWDFLFKSALRSRVALPLFVTTDYLANRLHAPIPAQLVDDLRAAAARTDAAGIEAAVAGLSSSSSYRRQGWPRPLIEALRRTREKIDRPRSEP